MGSDFKQRQIDFPASVLNYSRPAFIGLHIGTMETNKELDMRGVPLALSLLY